MRIGHWNVKGWGEKYRQIKIDIIKHTQCDVILLNETWFKSNEDTVDIMGYRWIGNNRKCINRRSKSGSGGVGILVSDQLYKRFHIEKVDDSYEGILAVSFTDICTDYSFVLFTLYLPREDSFHGRDSAKLYSNLMTLVYQCVDFDALYFAGDVNGRIGDKLDFIEEVDPVPHQVSIDHVFNYHGQALLIAATTQSCVQSTVDLIQAKMVLHQYQVKGRQL